jgi:four helix bundle protein
MGKTYSYKQLTVWQKGIQLTLLVYKLTKQFPKDEVYGLVSQIRRCVVSIPSNIAEGYTRHRRLEYIKFLQIAYASGAELETQLFIAKELGYIDVKSYDEVLNLLEEIMKMLNVLIQRLKESC